MTLEDILSVLSTAGNVLDTPRAMTWEALRGGNPLDVANPFDEQAVKRRPTGWDVLKSLGIEGREGLDWTDVPAVVLEAAGDPTNWLGGGLLAKVLGKAGKTKAVAKEAVASNLKREAGLAKGFMPEEVAAKTMLRTAPEAATPEATDLLSRHLNRFAAGEPMSTAEFAEAPKFRDLLEKQIVVDPELQGKPAMVYHGTTADFPAFDETKDVGFHFGNQMQAHDRLGDMFEGYPAGSNIRKQFLDVRNPLQVADVFGGEQSTAAQRLASELAKYLPQATNPARGASRATMEDLADWIRTSGYDSLVYPNRHEGPGLSAVALRAEQIYPPYIAPALREVPKVPTNNKLLAAMAGYNIGRQPRKGRPQVPELEGAY